MASSSASTTLPSGEHRLAVVILCLVGGLTPMQTQSMYIALPVELTHGLGEPASVMGMLVLVMTLGSLVGLTVLQPKMLKRMTPRAYLLAMCVPRILANLAHYAVLSSDPPPPYTVTVLYLSRFTHGLTLGVLALSNAWFGVRLPAEQRGAAIAYLNGSALIGAIVGQLLGGTLSGIRRAPIPSCDHSIPSMLRLAHMHWTPNDQADTRISVLAAALLTAWQPPYRASCAPCSARCSSSYSSFSLLMVA